MLNSVSTPQTITQSGIDDSATSSQRVYGRTLPDIFELQARILRQTGAKPSVADVIDQAVKLMKRAEKRA